MNVYVDTHHIHKYVRTYIHTEATKYIHTHPRTRQLQEASQLINKYTSTKIHTYILAQIAAATEGLLASEYVGVYVCGPQAMIIDVQGEKQLNHRISSLHTVRVHTV
jgi:hypothetical protein